jgi:ferredoxin
LLDDSVDVPPSCIEGVCRSCKIEVIEGMPDHRDVALGAEERALNNALMVCCSAPIRGRPPCEAKLKFGCCAHKDVPIVNLR